MRLIFIHHSHYYKNEKNRRKASLTTQGRKAIEKANKFLYNHNINPDIVITTKTQRTIETAEVILNILGIQPVIIHVNGGFASGRESLDNKILQWTHDRGDIKSLMFVGHKTQLNYLKKLNSVGITIPKGNKPVILIFDNIENEWILKAHFIGSKSNLL